MASAVLTELLAKKRKARLDDALIAQSCIDGGVPLIIRDHQRLIIGNCHGWRSSPE